MLFVWKGAKSTVLIGIPYSLTGKSRVAGNMMYCNAVERCLLSSSALASNWMLRITTLTPLLRRRHSRVA